ncbi:hypothetical protein B296_00042866 [Ensete ventricosum]|uniref:Uncharacterized protein n=1 Tax=Ensete ventricosum TaxID=4639 RepID=A0A426WZM9_ENSVE|nr:hypothetical protein B296_00042866 [Ensete ventricosum]
MRSCAQLLACGGVGLVPSGGSGTGWTERSSGVDPIEQGRGNSIGAGIDPTEWELGNLNGAVDDQTERGARESEWCRSCIRPSGDSGTNLGDLAERVNSSTNPGDLAERVNSGTNPRDLAERVNSGTNRGDLVERVNSGTNPGV